LHSFFDFRNPERQPGSQNSKNTHSMQAGAQGENGSDWTSPVSLKASKESMVNFFVDALFTDQFDILARCGQPFGEASLEYCCASFTSSGAGVGWMQLLPKLTADNVVRGKS
jgi:hypothetical protein